jgi:hypothetical protein
MIKKKRWGFIDRDGALAIDYTFDQAYDFSEGLATVKLGDAFAFINRNGTKVIQPNFEDARSFSEGLAAVKAGGAWGYIEPSGRLAIPPALQDGLRFTKYMLPQGAPRFPSIFLSQQENYSGFSPIPQIQPFASFTNI